MIKLEGEVEKIVDILVNPVKDLDIRYELMVHQPSPKSNDCHIVLKLLIRLFRRPIGSDLSVGDHLFHSQTYPGHVSYRSLLASVGVEVKVSTKPLKIPIRRALGDHILNLRLFQLNPHDAVEVCIISTGDELTRPGNPLQPGKIYDSNTTMLATILNECGFHKITSIVVEDK